MIEALVKWIIFAIGIGVTEGAFFAHGGYLAAWPYNIHKYLTIPRLIVGSFLFWDVWPFLPWYGLAIFCASLMAMFPIFHDGALYQTRHFLDFPLYNFFSKSDTTTSNFSLSFPERLVFFIAGILLYTWLIVIAG